MRSYQPDYSWMFFAKVVEKMKKVLVVLTGLLVVFLGACNRVTEVEIEAPVYYDDYEADDIYDEGVTEGIEVEDADVENDEDDDTGADDSVDIRVQFIGNWRLLSAQEFDADGNLLMTFFEASAETEGHEVIFYQDGSTSDDAEWRIEDDRLILIWGGVSNDIFYFEFDGDYLILKMPPNMGSQYIFNTYVRVR